MLVLQILSAIQAVCTHPQTMRRVPFSSPVNVECVEFNWHTIDPNHFLCQDELSNFFRHIGLTLIKILIKG